MGLLVMFQPWTRTCAVCNVLCDKWRNLSIWHPWNDYSSALQTGRGGVARSEYEVMRIPVTR